MFPYFSVLLCSASGTLKGKSLNNIKWLQFLKSITEKSGESMLKCVEVLVSFPIPLPAGLLQVCINIKPRLLALWVENCSPWWQHGNRGRFLGSTVDCPVSQSFQSFLPWKASGQLIEQLSFNCSLFRLSRNLGLIKSKGLCIWSHWKDVDDPMVAWVGAHKALWGWPMWEGSGSPLKTSLGMAGTCCMPMIRACLRLGVDHGIWPCWVQCLSICLFLSPSQSLLEEINKLTKKEGREGEREGGKEGGVWAISLPLWKEVLLHSPVRKTSALHFIIPWSDAESRAAFR